MDNGKAHVATFVRSSRLHLSRRLAPTSRAMAARNAIGVVVPLVVATLLHHPTSALIAGIGTLNVSLSDRPGLDVTKAPRMAWTVIGAAIAVFLGSLIGEHTLLVILASGLLALIVGLLSAYGAGVLQSGSTMIIGLLVASHRPHDLGGSLIAGGIVLAAGSVQTLLSLSAAPAPARNPDGHAFQRIFHELASYARAPETRGEVPAAIAITQAAAMQQAFAVYRSPQDRAPFLLSIHRLQSELMAVAESTRVLLDQQPQATEAWMRTCRALAETLDMTGGIVVGSATLHDAMSGIQQTRVEFDALSDAFAGIDRRHRQTLNLMVQVLMRRLDETAHLADVQREKRIGGLRWWSLADAMRERARATIQLIRLNVRSRSPMLRHAIRLAVCLVLAGSAAYFLDIPYWYWSPVAVVVVLRPYYADTLNRMTGAWIGQFLGLTLGTVVAIALPDSPWMGILSIGVFVFLQRLYGASNIAFGMGMVAAYIVSLLGLAGVSAQEAYIDRATNMLVGGAIAGLAFVVWPTWEHIRLRELVAECVDRYRDAFALAVPASIGDAALDLPRLTQHRTMARAARASAEEAIRRVQHEPNITPEQADAIDQMLRDLRGMVWSTLRLEAYLRIIRDGDIDQELHLAANEFIRATDRGLQRISHALVAATAPPDLAAAAAEAVRWMEEALQQVPASSTEPAVIAWRGAVTESAHHAHDLARLQQVVTSLAKPTQTQ